MSVFSVVSGYVRRSLGEAGGRQRIVGLRGSCALSQRTLQQEQGEESSGEGTYKN